MENQITKRQKLEEELDDTERSCKYHKKIFQKFQRGEFSLGLRLCLRLSRKDESLWSLVFVLVFFLNKSPVEKTSSEYRFGTLLSLADAVLSPI